MSNAMTSEDDIGNVWYGAGGDLYTPETSAGGLEAIVSDAKYGPC